MKRAFYWGYNHFAQHRSLANPRDGLGKVVSLTGIGMGTGAVLFSDPFKNSIITRSLAQARGPDFYSGRRGGDQRNP